ncbi:MAG: glycosyltransferase [Candidatus Marinimicrobia bacterium]|nr:glycosyltransferase [Candidatus Neomarinimicrobiota bacterium]
MIITYYWPPSGGPGVQRVLKFAKYLPQFGWQPIVLTVKDGEYPAIDETLERDIPAECKVFKTKSIEPFAVYKFFQKGKKTEKKINTFVMADSKKSLFSKITKFIRANFFIPDARIGWYPFAVKKGREIVKNEGIDLIFSSSPPHSLQLIAQKIAQKTGLPWVADFRDPWSDFFIMSDNYQTNLAQRISRSLELKVLTRTNAFITVSKFLAEKYQSKTQNACWIHNGFDDFHEKKEPSVTFRIKYLGSMSKLQVPENFIRTISKLENIDIDFFGNFDGELEKSMVRHHCTNIRLHGYIPLNQVKAEIKNADLLLLTIPSKNGEGILTGKLFQLLGSGNRILCISNDDNKEIREIITHANIGETFNYQEDVQQFLENEIKNWQIGQIPKPNFDYINQFHRKNLTQKLVGIFEQYIG